MKKQQKKQKGKLYTSSGVRPPRQGPAATALTGRHARARWRRLARDIVYRTPEVRLEKVASLKEAIAQGTYEIDSQKLAEIIVDELLGKR